MGPPGPVGLIGPAGPPGKDGESGDDGEVGFLIIHFDKRLNATSFKDWSTRSGWKSWTERSTR